MADTEANMTLEEWRSQCPWLDKPDHDESACYHCATDDELEAALFGGGDPDAGDNDDHE